MSFDATQPAKLTCALLRGEEAAFPLESGFAERFLTSARYQGIAALLNETPGASKWPQAIRDALQREAVKGAMWELRHRQLLEVLLSRLAQAGVTPVIFKGTALAYSLYGSAALRSRGDTDLIIEPRSLEQCRQVLADCGFRRDFAIPGVLVSSEESWSLGGHVIDLHRKISNSPVLSGLFTHDELLAASRPLAALSPHARGAGHVHALLIACMHRATHRNIPYYVDGVEHYGGDRLIWLCDIRLLAQQMSEGDWEALVRMARSKGLSGICREALNSALTCLGFVVPNSVMVALAQAGEGERPGIHLRAGRLRQACMDVYAIEGNAARVAFLKEVLFPPRHYMLAKYPQAIIPLPLLYLHRAFSGVIARLSKAETGSKA